MTLPAARLPVGWTLAPDTLAERVVLVTGATGGLGRATAIACAQAGATVLLTGRKVRALEKVYDAIVALPHAAQPMMQPLDLQGASPLEYQTLASTISDQLGHLDGIAHAAARFDLLTPLALLDPEAWVSTLHVNLSAPFLLTQACMPLLQARADSAAIFVLDDPGRMRRAHWGAYGVAKAGLEGLFSILHQETDESSMRVHALLPAPMRTALRQKAWFGEDTQRIASPDAAAQAMVYLLSAEGAAARGAVLDLRGDAGSGIGEQGSRGEE